MNHPTTIHHNQETDRFEVRLTKQIARNFKTADNALAFQQGYLAALTKTPSQPQLNDALESFGSQLARQLDHIICLTREIEAKTSTIWEHIKNLQDELMRPPLPNTEQPIPSPHRPPPHVERAQRDAQAQAPETPPDETRHFRDEEQK